MSFAFDRLREFFDVIVELLVIENNRVGRRGENSRVHRTRKQQQAEHDGCFEDVQEVSSMRIELFSARGNV